VKKTLTDLEFFKSDLNLIENHLIELEKFYVLSSKEIQNTKSNLRNLNNAQLKEYNKIIIKNLTQYIKKIEEIHDKNHKNILKVFRKIEQLKNISILDHFYNSVDTHIIKKIKKEYDLKPKSIKEKSYYIIFHLKSTYYCIYGKIQKILLFSSIESLKNYLNFIKENEKQTTFPHLETLNIFLPENTKKIYLAIIYNDKNQKTYYIIFYNKLLCKKKIENLRFYPSKNKYVDESIINHYFLYKAKKIYYIY